MTRVRTLRARHSYSCSDIRLLLLICLGVFAMSGCALPVALLDKSRPESPNLIVVPMHGESTAAGLTRAEVRTQLGEPMLVGPNEDYYIYKRVVEDRRPVLYWVFPYVPLPLPEQMAHTQIVGVWFDADGRVETMIEDLTRNAHEAYWLPTEREVARLDKWMQDHRPPLRRPGTEKSVDRSASPEVPAEATAVVVFDVPFGISVNRFQAANPRFQCREVPDRLTYLLGDQSCYLIGQACRLGETTEACLRSSRQALNFLGVVPSEALALNSRPRALAQSRNAYFVDNRLGAVTWRFDGRARDDVLRAVEGQYGQAQETTIEGDPPPGWGPQKMTNTVWRDSGAKLIVSCNRPGFLSGVGACIVWIGTDAYEAEVARRRAARQRNGAAAK